MRSRTLKAPTVTVASAAAVLLAGSPSAAAGLPWSATHGTATAGGSRWLEKAAGILSSTLVVEGEIKNTGFGCYSLWTMTVHDLAPGPARKVATQCGPGTEPVSFKTSYAPTTTGYVHICKDDASGGCGQQTSITTWPIQKPVPAAITAE
ncbi:hypothetical protein [Streptomyces sp. NPDC085540]|uniref:hypothetical protein n=1 Tax=Streptomyces sp. NPDC085540 TaxID=3365730 RepID=UPI0037CEE3EF